MIAEVLGNTIDFSKITRVSKIGGDENWLRYTVYFVGGDKIDIYENRLGEGFPREKFVELWKKLANNYA